MNSLSNFDWLNALKWIGAVLSATMILAMLSAIFPTAVLYGVLIYAVYGLAKVLKGEWLSNEK